MSDQTGGSDPRERSGPGDEAWAPEGAAPPPPPPPGATVPPVAPGAGAATLPEPSAARPGRRPGTVVAIVVGVLALAAGAVFAAQALTDDDGSGGPEEAVQNMLDAIANEDAIGVLEALAPGERDALRPGIEDLTDELQRLEILSDDLDLRDIGGLDLAFEDVELTSETVRDGMARVRLAGGTARYDVDPAALPLGSVLRDLIGGELEPVSGSDTIESEEADEFFVAIEDDDGWYVSIGYTAAESARESEGAALPAADAGVQPQGGSSARDAVEQLLRSSLALDLRRVISLLPPGEMGALQQYAPLFLPQAEAGLSELRASGAFTAELTDLQLENEDLGSGQTLVTIASFTLEATIQGESATVAFDGSCFSFTGQGPAQRVCADQIVEGFGSQTGLDLDLDDLRFGVVAVEEGGAFYVSPTRTLLTTFVNVLRIFDADDVRNLPELIGGYLFGATTSESFSSTGSAEGGDTTDSGVDDECYGMPCEEFEQLSAAEKQRVIQQSIDQSGAGDE